MNILANAKLFIFDLDGTVYQDDVLIGDAKNTLNFLRGRGAKIVYLTNNSNCTKKTYEEKLKRLEIFEDGDIVYSSLDCAIDFIKKYRQDKKFYAVASQSVREYLNEQGLNIVNEENAKLADAVLLTLDKEINYDKIITANELLLMGKEYISTHSDLVWPRRGIPAPDAGSFIAMFRASSNREPDIVLGKPYAYMSEFLINSLGVTKEQSVMVGDRLTTDILFGVNSGFTTITVLTGEATLETCNQSKIKSDYVLKDINEIPKLINEKI